MDRVWRKIPATKSWAWFWQARDWVFGQRKPVNLFLEICALESLRAPAADLTPTAPAFANDAGLRVWLLTGAELKTARARLEQAPGTEILSRPRVSTADECAASMFVGNSVPVNSNAGGLTQVGLAVDFYPRVLPHSTDLITALTVSELVTNSSAPNLPPAPAFVRTNLDVAVRLQIPKGRGVLLIDASGGFDGKPIAVILDPP